ncbi:MAG TPA: hypothetical protein VEX60_16140 [Pyrinomonadaceae bacterium]|nr:hypothetical protein [Pyrinomonadaceae bacterium]
MSELNERRWAVISERGREAEGLPYAEARSLAQSLRGEKLSGLCVVTDAAASYLPPAKTEKKKKSGGNNAKRRSDDKKKGAAPNSPGRG